jgi:hypothetical protein
MLAQLRASSCADALRGRKTQLMTDPASRFSNLSGFAVMNAAGNAPASNPSASQAGSLMTLAQLYDFARQQAVATQRLKWHALLERLLQ